MHCARAVAPHANDNKSVCMCAAAASLSLCVVVVVVTARAVAVDLNFVLSFLLFIARSIIGAKMAHRQKERSAAHIDALRAHTRKFSA